jgi:signal transduction histidine kinase
LDTNSKSKFIATTWGTLLIILLLTLVSVGIYAPIKNYALQSFSKDAIEYHLILVLAIAALSILMLTITAFAIPYSWQKEAAITRLFNKMFLELKALVWLGFALTFFLNLRVTSSYHPDYYPDYYPAHYVNAIYDANQFFYLIGIPVTFILLLLIYLSICYIKHIYHEGVKEAIIKNSLIGRPVLYLLGRSKAIAKRLLAIDLTKEYYKKLILIILTNLLLLSLMSKMRFFGTLLGIAYSVVLFNYFDNLINKAKTISDVTSKLAEGDFEIAFEGDEDMGIFSPISDNLLNIKNGFKVAVDQEIKSQNLKNELITNVSHDLKTPLTSIITYIDLLKDKDLTEDNRGEYLEILEQKSQRLKILIEDLFEASKASSGNIELHFEDLDVVALLRQTLGELEEQIKESSLNIKVNAPEDNIICKLDGRRTYRVFENIMNNIFKYSMPNSRVYIDVLETNKEVSLVFKNISAYEMNFDASEITERFLRGDKARTTGGSGLGLAIAKSLVELQGGKMEIMIDGDLFKLILSFTRAA